MIAMVELVSTSITSHNCHFIFVVRTFQVYSQQLSSIQYSIVNYNTMLYIKSSELTYFVIGSVYVAFDQHLPIPQPLTTTIHSTLCFSEFYFFRFHI